jgi:GTP cyclohydrolase IA
MSLDGNKTNTTLGWEIQSMLEEKGVATPTKRTGLLPHGKINLLEKKFTSVLDILGLDMADDSLRDTPARLAKMFVNELFWGLDPNNFPKCTAVANKMQYDEMVIERNIGVMSTCEHHFQTIAGVAHVAYIPNEMVLGLSKLNRVVEYFSRRPQIQERLTEQVYFALSCILETENVAVVIDAEHFCVKARGVEDHGSSTITSKLGGVFKTKPEVRSEFMSLIKP